VAFASKNYSLFWVGARVARNLQRPDACYTLCKTGIVTAWGNRPVMSALATEWTTVAALRGAYDEIMEAATMLFDVASSHLGSAAEQGLYQYALSAHITLADAEQDFTLALTRASQATRRFPNSPSLTRDLGLLQRLAGDEPSARVTLLRAAHLWLPHVATGPSQCTSWELVDWANDTQRIVRQRMQQQQQLPHELKPQEVSASTAHGLTSWMLRNAQVQATADDPPVLLVREGCSFHLMSGIVNDISLESLSRLQLDGRKLVRIRSALLLHWQPSRRLHFLCEVLPKMLFILQNNQQKLGITSEASGKKGCQHQVLLIHSSWVLEFLSLLSFPLECVTWCNGTSATYDFEALTLLGPHPLQGHTSAQYPPPVLPPSFRTNLRQVRGDTPQCMPPQFCAPIPRLAAHSSFSSHILLLARICSY